MQVPSDFDLSDVLGEKQGLDDSPFNMPEIFLDFYHLVYLYSELDFDEFCWIIYKLCFALCQ